MEVNLVNIDCIIPYARNPRKNDDAIDKVASSIKEFGFRQPIVVDEGNVIIVGHTRYQAAKKLEIENIPVHVARGLSKEQIKAYRLADNRIAQYSEWDNQLLSYELQELKDLDYDLENTGFLNEEIEELLNPEIFNEGLIDDDYVPDLSTDPITRLGDVWILGNHRLICGDSTNPDIVNKLLLDKKPILMVTDPPYGVNYNPEWRDDVDLGIGERSRGKVKNDNKVDWSDSYSLFNGDIVYIWHAAKFSAEVALHIKACEYEIVSQIIWAKQHFSISRGDYHWQHEPCWYAVKKGKNHNWQGSRDQSTVWQIKNNNSFGNSEKEETWGHGTQKPIECMLRPIQNNTKPNEYVYDPFGGSGTTLIACEKIGRKCLMIELDEKYCDIIIKRWQKYTGKKAMLESTGKSFEELSNG